MANGLQTIIMERDSVCMGDDVNAPNTTTLQISGEMDISQFLKQLANELPTVADPEPIVWSVHSVQSSGTAIGLIETVYQVGSKVRLFVPDGKMQKSGISKVYCRYFCKSSLMLPDQEGYLRIPQYPECPTLAEKVIKHLNVSK